MELGWEGGSALILLPCARPRSHLHTWDHMQYCYEEHQGDDVAAADTDEPNLLAVRLLWSSTHCQHNVVRFALDMAKSSAKHCQLSCYPCTAVGLLPKAPGFMASQILLCRFALSG